MVGNGTGRFTVVCSGAIREEILRIHRRATQQGRGPAVTQAIRDLMQRLERDPFQVGEPAYRLPDLRLQMCLVIIHPLVVDFAIAEDRPLVFLKGISLLKDRNA